MLDLTTHAILIATGLIGTAVLAFSFRKKQLWAAPLMYAVPVCFAVPTAEALLLGLAPWFPSFPMDDSPWDAARFTVLMFLLIPSYEILYQRIVTSVAGNGAFYSPAPTPEASPQADSAAPEDLGANELAPPAAP